MSSQGRFCTAIYGHHRLPWHARADQIRKNGQASPGGMG